MSSLIIDHYNNKGKTAVNPEVSQTSTLFKKLNIPSQVAEGKTFGASMNNIFKILIPVMTGIFVFVYFALTINK